MRLDPAMMACNGCAALLPVEEAYALVCHGGVSWPNGVPESPPCFEPDYEARRAQFVVINGS